MSSVTVGTRQQAWREHLAKGLQAAAARWKWPILVSFVVFYLTVTSYRAWRKLFWFDEIFTIEVARLPDWSALWNALQRGVELNPPLFYLLTRAGEQIAGQGHLGARLPEIVGFGVFCLCLFRFVAKRSSVLGGLLAMLFPLVTNAYWYAYEARPHGLVMGFCGLTLVCWQQAAGGTERRAGWLLGLSAALAGAVLSHAYAVLIFIPVIAGEVARWVERRRVDLPMYAAVSIASLACAPLFTAARLASTPGIAGDPPRRAQSSIDQFIAQVADSYEGQLGEASLTIAIALAILVASRRASHSVPAGTVTACRGPMLHEFVALCALVSLPLFAALLAKATGTSLYHRYSISAVGGVAALLGFGFARRSWGCIVLLLAMLVHFMAGTVQFARSPYLIEPSTKMRLSTHQPDLLDQYKVLESYPEDTLPIALLDNLEFATTFRYAPSALAGRMTYVMKGRSDGNGRGYARLMQCCNAPGRVVGMTDFMASHPRFLAYGPVRSLHRLAEIAHAGGSVTLVDISPGRYLALITREPELAR